MTISNTLDMISMTGTSTSTSSATVPTDEGTGSSEFESLLQENAQDTVTGQETNSDSAPEANADKDDVSTNVGQEEISDAQRELMAALTMQATPVYVIETVETVAVTGVVVEETVVATEETPLLDNEMLNMGEGEISPQLGNETQEEPTMDLETGSENQGAFVLEEVETMELDETVELPEIDLTEVTVEGLETEEVVVETAPVEVQQDVVVETVVENEAPEVDVDSAEPVVKTDTSAQVVEVEVEGTKVFDKVENTPVKVGETVNTQEPDMDEQIAKIISQAEQNGDKTVTIQLTPESLGTITVQLTQSSDGVLQVVLQATDAAAAKLLGSHADSIALALHTNGSTVSVEVEAKEVAENTESGFQDQESQEREQSQEEREREEEQKSVNEDFLQQLRLGLVEFSDLLQS